MSTLASTATKPLVTVNDMAMTFDVSPSLLTRVIERQPKLFLHAVDGVSFEIEKGKTLALVGSSQTKNSGLVASARAIEIRWRCPPENWCGNLGPSSGLRPTDLSRSPTLAFSSALSVMMPCSKSGSPIMSSTIQRGFSDAYGSWKIIWMRSRSFRP